MIRRIFEFIKSMLIAIAAAVFIILFVIETVSVDGNSMLPTLNNKDRIVIEKLSYRLKQPKVDDIVVFKYPADTREKFIKRIVAVSGDTVRIEEGKLYINGIEKNEVYLNEEVYSGFFGEVKVPKNTIFVLGDNRNYSKDSRSSDIGFVSTKLLVGRAILRIYPLNNIGRIR